MRKYWRSKSGSLIISIVALFTQQGISFILWPIVTKYFRYSISADCRKFLEVTSYYISYYHLMSLNKILCHGFVQILCIYSTFSNHFISLHIEEKTSFAFHTNRCHIDNKLCFYFDNVMVSVLLMLHKKCK